MQSLAGSTQAAREQLTHSSMRSGMRDTCFTVVLGWLPVRGVGVKQFQYDCGSTDGQGKVKQLDKRMGRTE